MISNYKKLTIKETISFYEKLLKNEIISEGGGAHKRMDQLKLMLKNKMGWANKR